MLKSSDWSKAWLGKTFGGEHDMASGKLPHVSLQLHLLLLDLCLLSMERVHETKALIPASSRPLPICLHEAPPLGLPKFIIIHSC